MFQGGKDMKNKKIIEDVWIVHKKETISCMSQREIILDGDSTGHLTDGKYVEKFPDNEWYYVMEDE